MGALVMYSMSMASLFHLRRRDPSLNRPFKAPFYPVFPAFALLMSLVSLLAVIIYNPLLFLVFVLMFVPPFLYLRLRPSGFPADGMARTTST